ncbi:MAG: hypothetical protein NVS2B16_33030 [Chloroflexota bacterium]
MHFGKVEHLGRWYWSISSVFVSLPLYWYGGIIAFTGATFLQSLMMLLVPKAQRRLELDAPLDALVAMTGAAWLSIMAAALLGDGLIDIAKHFHAAHSLFVIIFALGVFRATQILVKVRQVAFRRISVRGSKGVEANGSR